MTILAELLDQTARKPNRTFLYTENEVYSYARFQKCISSFAGYLESEYKILEGQRVVLCFPNEAEYLIAYFAVLMLGAVAIPVDGESKSSTLCQIIQDAEPVLLIHSRKKEMTEMKDKIQCVAFPEKDVYLGYPTYIASADVKPGNLAIIMYTSGTTGAPKGVMLSHDNLLFTARRIIEWAEMKPNDREITTLRLSHSFGLGHIHCYILLGAEIVLIESVREPQRLFHYIKKYGVTGFPATPGLIHLLVNYFRTELQAISKQLSYVVINTAPINQELLEQFLELLPNTRVYMYYGLTEASRSTYIAYRKHLSKLTSVGKPPKGVQVRVDSYTREVQIKGHNVMLGYLNHKESFMSDGWFATGDIGHWDEDGFLFIDGRLKDQINADGLKINPIEVENVIRKHPAVNDCMVFGVSDPLTFERPVASIVCNDPYVLDLKLSGELKRLCKRELEFYKIPREIRQWTSLPRTESGKKKRKDAKILWERGETI